MARSRLQAPAVTDQLSMLSADLDTLSCDAWYSAGVEPSVKILNKEANGPRKPQQVWNHPQDDDEERPEQPDEESSGTALAWDEGARVIDTDPWTYHSERLATCEGSQCHDPGPPTVTRPARARVARWRRRTEVQCMHVVTISGHHIALGAAVVEQHCRVEPSEPHIVHDPTVVAITQDVLRQVPHTPVATHTRSH